MLPVLLNGSTLVGKPTFTAPSPQRLYYKDQGVERPLCKETTGCPPQPTTPSLQDRLHRRGLEWHPEATVQRSSQFRVCRLGRDFDTGTCSGSCRDAGSFKNVPHNFFFFFVPHCHRQGRRGSPERSLSTFLGVYHLSFKRFSKCVPPSFSIVCSPPCCLCFKRGCEVFA